MATITPTVEYDGRHILWTWTGAATDDTINPAKIEHRPADILVAVVETGDGGTLSFSGSIDDTTYIADLVDPGGTAISLTATGGSALRDAWLYIKPAITGGTGGTWVAKLLARI